MTMRLFMVLAAALATVACAPSPGTSPGATTSAKPNGTAQPTTTAGATAPPVASPAAVVREIDPTKFTATGGCGDTFLWAATPDDTTAITIEWQGAASDGWEEDGFNEMADLPDGRIRVTLVTGRLLSTTYCTDVLGPDAGSVSEVPAASGSVSLSVRPDAARMRPSGQADLTLTEVEFEVTVGTKPEVWRLPTLELHDVLVGWFAG